MAGEPEWFDVAKLEAIEIETATGDEIPSNIIDWGENFYLKATFEGKAAEMQWHNMKTGKVEYIARFYGEGMGPGVPDKNFGTTKGNLKPGKDVYAVKSPTTSITGEGIWRCGVTVEFRWPNTGARWYGVLGHNEGCVIQIHISEEPQ
ncbi:MAG: hypothetical protein KAW49_08050 [Anaerolineae bacterium]|nr:hypothetical protein [Anaerolineae bacterium]